MKDFVRLSKYAGMREDLVQAGGGNSSFKISDEKMAIKSSGYQLAEITGENGYTLVNPQIIKEGFLECNNLDAVTEKDGDAILKSAFIEGSKPSIETFLHAISGRYTLHTHPIVVNALTCRKQGIEVIKELFPEALIVPYATPGVKLAKTYFTEYKKVVAEGREVFDIVFLQNHGLVVSAESADEVIKKTEEVTSRIEQFLNIRLDEYHKLTRLWGNFPDKVVWKVTDNNVLNSFSKIGEWKNVFCPDCVVFLGKRFLNLSEDFTSKDIDDFYSNFGTPVIINYAGTLYIVAESVKKAMEIQSVMSFSGQVMAINQGIECNLLSDDEQNFLLNWDAEKYRRTMK